MCHGLPDYKSRTCYNSNRLHMLWCTNTNNLLEYLVITLWLPFDYIPLILFCFIKNIFENISYKVLYKNTLWILRKSSSSGYLILLKEFFYPRILLMGLFDTKPILIRLGNCPKIILSSVSPLELVWSVNDFTSTRDKGYLAVPLVSAWEWARRTPRLILARQTLNDASKRPTFTLSFA